MVSENPSVATKKKGKKRRISKHIVNSRLKSSQDGTEVVSEDVSSAPAPATRADSPNVVKKRKLSTKRRHVKDPTDVAGYLTAWKSCDDEKQNKSTTSSSSQSSWKFNKNTQSWLIRHLYDGSKVTKTVFTDALLYFGKANDAVQLRLRQDATMRALRYQQYINSSKESSGSNLHCAGTNDGGLSHDSNDPDSTRGAIANEISKADFIDSLLDNTQWSQLDEHDRRKEYKRARKVLETLTVRDSENSI
jgi:WKF domain